MYRGTKNSFICLLDIYKNFYTGKRGAADGAIRKFNHVGSGSYGSCCNWDQNT